LNVISESFEDTESQETPRISEVSVESSRKEEEDVDAAKKSARGNGKEEVKEYKHLPEI
jgi:hypothetical protein